LIPVLAIVAMLAIASPAFAGKGGGGKGGHGGKTAPSGGLILNVVNDINLDTLPNWGESISFTVTSTATSEPHVSVVCKQNGVVVYGATTGYYPTYPWPWTQVMILSSQMWTGGEADCKATLYAYSGSTSTAIGGLAFTVYA
jgi:hypothetical protein